MKKFWITLLAITALVLVGAPAHAAGSDSPTPYEVGLKGIVLPEGDTFPSHGHINIKVTDSKGNNPQSKGIHFDPNNGHPGGQWIGKNFIPWSAFGLEDDWCLTWVQVHGYNEHYGEGEHKQICVPPTNPCTIDAYAPGCDIPPAPESWLTSDERVNPVICENGATGFGTVTTEMREGTRTPEWIETEWSWVLPLEWTWGDWYVVSEDRVESSLCDPLAESGSEVSPALLAGGAVIVLAGGTLLFWRKKEA